MCVRVGVRRERGVVVIECGCVIVRVRARARLKRQRFYRDQLLLMAMMKCWRGTSAPVAAIITQDSEAVCGAAAAR